MQYAWLILSLLLLGVWLIIFVFNKDNRKEMLTVSLWTSLLGFTEPFFVPEYWSPLSLFDLAERTGFDLESFIFSFAIGGIAVSVYELMMGVHHKRMHKHSQKQLHLAVIVITLAAFLFLYFTAGFNPIYSAIIALLIGFLITSFLRQDLVGKMLASGVIFFIIYFLSFTVLNKLFPGYYIMVWNIKDLSGVFLMGVPVEELLWAFTFGLYWSSIYEYIGGYKIIK